MQLPNTRNNIQMVTNRLSVIPLSIHKDGVTKVGHSWVTSYYPTLFVHLHPIAAKILVT